MKRFKSLCIMLLILGSTLVTLPDIGALKVEDTIYIRANGTVEGTDKILRDGDVYTLTGNLSTGIKVQRNDTVIDGAGYTLQGGGEKYGVGVDLSALASEPRICNVTIKNLRVTNFYRGIENSNAAHNTFIGNYIADCSYGFRMIGSSKNTLRYNTLKDSGGIIINYGGPNNTITRNNFINNSITVCSLSSKPTVDMNYWSDYNGTDSDGDGIGDTPCIYIDADWATYKDYNPLMAPITVFDAGRWEGTSYYVDVVSNSTVSGFSFDSETARIRFDVEEETGATGFCRVAIPKDLLHTENTWTVLVNEEPVTPSVSEGQANTYLYFAYHHSIKTVEIQGTTAIPEYPAWFPLLLLMVVATVTGAIYATKIKR